MVYVLTFEYCDKLGFHVCGVTANRTVAATWYNANDENTIKSNLIYNNTESGRHDLTAAISTNEGKSWDRKRRLEYDDRGDTATRSHYPSVIQGRDGLIHVIYSYHHNDRQGGPHKTVKYARFEEAWISVKE